MKAIEELEGEIRQEVQTAPDFQQIHLKGEWYSLYKLKEKLKKEF